MLHLSVVMPVRNEEKHIARVLDRLLAQNYDHDKLEIIVVDGLSEDKTPEIVQGYVDKYPSIVRYLVNPKKLSSAARNIGAQHAQGEAVLIVDGHCIIDNDDMLRNVSDAFIKTGADCLGRPQPLELRPPSALRDAERMIHHVFEHNKLHQILETLMLHSLNFRLIFSLSHRSCRRRS